MDTRRNDGVCLQTQVENRTSREEKECSGKTIILESLTAFRGQATYYCQQKANAKHVFHKHLQLKRGIEKRKRKSLLPFRSQKLTKQNKI